jgi:pimeloyl-[acyl-carrier protein] synthase
MPQPAENNLTDNWYTPEFYADPYPYYDAVRNVAPVIWSESEQGWVVTGYEQVAAILHDPERFSSAGRMAALLDRLPVEDRDHFQPIYDHFSGGIIRSDPPDHTRLRQLINATFTPRVIKTNQANIETTMRRLFDQFEADQNVDLVSQFAFPLPATVICRMLGVPTDDLEQVRDWTIRINSVVAGALPLREAAEEMQKALVELQDYYRAMIAQRHQSPQEDLMSLLVAAEDEGERLTEAELLSTAENLLAAGHETTTNLISNTVLTLLRHPQQWQRLATHPDGIPQAVEEVLRYESPLQRQTRIVKQDMTFEGQSLRQGQIVYLMIGAANRDPAAFVDPNCFDIERTNNRHLAFGVGVHFCIGAPLARLEGKMALEALLREFPKMQLAGDHLRWSPTAAIRGPVSLPVQLTP